MSPHLTTPTRAAGGQRAGISIASIYSGCFVTGLAIVLLAVKANGRLSVRRESGGQPVAVDLEGWAKYLSLTGDWLDG